jgi:hypothetical protein
MTSAPQHFVGRLAELLVLERLLQPNGPRVAYLHGVGGIGKTSLIRAFMAAHPELVADEVDSTALPTDLSGLLDRARAADLLIIDGLEQVPGLGELVRRQILGRLVPGARLIVASRDAPHPRWATELGPGGLVEIALEGLDPPDAARLLTTWGAGDRDHDALIELCHGHPLTLALAAQLTDLDAFVQSGIEASPELLVALLESVGARQSDALDRDALTVSAIARRVTVALLGDVLGVSRPAVVFDALCGQSWCLADRDGVYPHDLVRDVIRADAKWRDRARYDQLFARIADHVTARLRAIGPSGLPDALFLLADHALYGRVAAHRNAMLPGPLVPSDIGTVRAMLAPLHGAASVDHVARWVERGRCELRVVHGPDGEPSEAACLLDAQLLFEDAPCDDPAVTVARGLVAQLGLRPGAPLVVSRLSGSAGFGLTHPLGNARVMAAGLRRGMAMGAVAGLVTVVGPASFWAPIIEHNRGLAVFAPVRIGAGDFFVVVHDLRFRDIPSWLHGQLFPPALPSPPAVETLDRDEFGCAVRDALRVLNDPVALAATRLARTPLAHRLASGRGDVGPAVARACREAIARAGARDARVRSVLDRTYVTPAPKQYAAAVDLGLSFATYRRALATGVAAIVDALWADEVATWVAPA